MSGRRLVTSLVGEFIGTYVLATAMLSMLVRTNFEFFSAVAAAAVYGVMWLVMSQFGGAQLNPAVTLGLWSAKKVSTVQGVVNIVAQVLAGLAAWGLSQYFLNQTLPKTASGGWNWRIAVAEGVGTLVFTFGVAAAVSKKEDHSRQAAIVGLAVFAGILVASLASNGLLNPAVAISVRSLSWAYVAGPLVGGIIGINLYTLFFTDDLVGAKKGKK
jgi:glycerol uptake facilitator-like aquaporin